MRDILVELNSLPGVRGSAIVMTDGVVIASELSTGADADSYSALASSLLSNINKNIPKLDLGGMRRAMITATRGRFAIQDVGGAWLIVELERDIDLGQLQLEIESSAGRLRRRMRMGRPETPAALPADAKNNSNSSTKMLLTNDLSRETSRAGREAVRG